MQTALTSPGESESLGEPVSADGYVRLSLGQVGILSFFHLISGLDVELVSPASGGSGAMATAIAGYTEWATRTLPALSMGWDWVAEVHGKGLRYCRSGEPRSNIMLRDWQQRDLGDMRSAVVLGLAVDGWNWQDEVARFVSSRST